MTALPRSGASNSPQPITRRLPIHRPQLDALVLVINEEFRELPFLTEAMAADPRIKFADPGAERQDSVSNGLNQVPEGCTLVAIHDSARPLVTLDDVHQCLADGAEHGAAVLAVPMKATVKARHTLHTLPTLPTLCT